MLLWHVYKETQISLERPQKVCRGWTKKTNEHKPIDWEAKKKDRRCGGNEKPHCFCYLFFFPVCGHSIWKFALITVVCGTTGFQKVLLQNNYLCDDDDDDPAAVVPLILEEDSTVEGRPEPRPVRERDRLKKVCVWVCV